MKVLLRYEKGEPARWIGHLDLQRAFARALRRAGLPVSFSEGFNPRPRLAFASALGVGVTGSGEAAMLTLSEPVGPDDVASRLNAVLPRGLRVTGAEEVAVAEARAALGAFRAASYRVECEIGEGVSVQSVDDALRALLGSTEALVTRTRDGRSSPIEARRQIRRLAVAAGPCASARVVLEMELGMESEGSVRPAEVVGLLALSVPGLLARRIHRNALLVDPAG